MIVGWWLKKKNLIQYISDFYQALIWAKNLIKKYQEPVWSSVLIFNYYHTTGYNPKHMESFQQIGYY